MVQLVLILFVVYEEERKHSAVLANARSPGAICDSRGSLPSPSVPSVPTSDTSEYACEFWGELSFSLSFLGPPSLRPIQVRRLRQFDATISGSISSIATT